MARLTILFAALLSGLVLAGLALGNDNQNWSVHASGDLELPARDTLGQGQAIFHLSKDGTAIEYKLIASNIENVTASHIHLGGSTVNGPVVAFLFGNAPAGGGRTDGVLAEGTITAADLVGPLAGQPLSALIDAMNSGNAYVNVHTNDGVAPTNTGAGDFPGGEIRGNFRELLRADEIGAGEILPRSALATPRPHGQTDADWAVGPIRSAW